MLRFKIHNLASKFFLGLAALSMLMGLLAPMSVAAEPTTGQPIGNLSGINVGPLPGAGSNNATSDMITKVLQIVFGIAGALALLVITISGFRYVTSAGDPQQASQAKNAIIYALIGLLVAMFAEAIVSFVVGKL